MNNNNYIKLAKRSALIQIKELKKINKVFNNSFVKAVNQISSCKGKIIFAGIGKSGLIARKISATFSSVGIPSFFCDPAQCATAKGKFEIHQNRAFRNRQTRSPISGQN